MTCPTWCTRRHHDTELEPCHSRAILDVRTADDGSVGVAVELDEAGTPCVFVEASPGILTTAEALALGAALQEAVRVVEVSA